MGRAEEEEVKDQRYRIWRRPKGEHTTAWFRGAILQTPMDVSLWVQKFGYDYDYEITQEMVLREVKTLTMEVR